MMFLAVQLVEVLLFPAHMLFDGDLLAAGLVLVVFFAVELVVLRPVSGGSGGAPLWAGSPHLMMCPQDHPECLIYEQMREAGTKRGYTY